MDELNASTATTGRYNYLPDENYSRLKDVRVGSAAPLNEMQFDDPKSFIWFTGDIENAAGSAYSDEIYGSVLNNRIFGDERVDRVTDFNRADGDRVLLDPGTTYTLAQSGADTVVEMGGGGRVVLVGVSMSSLSGDWIAVG